MLKTVDFSRLNIKVIMVELDGHAPEKDAAVIELLQKEGYEVIPKVTVGSLMNDYNTVFVHKAEWGSLAHAPNITEPITA